MIYKRNEKTLTEASKLKNCSRQQSDPSMRNQPNRSTSLQTRRAEVYVFLVKFNTQRKCWRGKERGSVKERFTVKKRTFF